MFIDDLTKRLNEAVPIPTQADVAKAKEERAAADAAQAEMAAAMAKEPPEKEKAPETPEDPSAAPQVPGQAPETPEDKDSKSERAEVRLSAADKTDLENAANNLGLSVSAYLLFLHKSRQKPQS
ncbi:MAG: hypothetical protein Q8K86_05790 [Candidatus Nanopelagicaceae bacterium]|nr:hypothetical protein [Candidatus Nanopelagicaceae bacterium]